nr:hypothetical protein Iba_chr10aCG9050 [Ipomoea batatas]
MQKEVISLQLHASKLSFQKAESLEKKEYESHCIGQMNPSLALEQLWRPPVLLHVENESLCQEQLVFPIPKSMKGLKHYAVDELC